MGQLLDKAIEFATNAHKGQCRKGSEIPYILHPLEAAAIAATITQDDTVLAASVLHDVVEDTETTEEQIRAVFGEKVAMLVAAESENKREESDPRDTWEIRKRETLEHLLSASTEVKIITLGDKLSNIRAIYRDYLLIGEELWQRFNQKDKSRHAWYYYGIADCLKELEQHTAYKEYVDLVKKVFEQ